MNTPGHGTIEDAASRLRRGAARLACMTSEEKNGVLIRLAASLREYAGGIARANGRDIEAAVAAGLAAPKVARLRLGHEAVERMAQRVEYVASLPDPVGQVTRDVVVQNGLRVRKVRAPLGVIAIIYESRPDVTVDAFSLCFKAGNACLLKGGKEAVHTNVALMDLVGRAVGSEQGLEAAWLFTSSDRSELQRLLSLDTLIDLVIPRGGKDLIRFVRDHSKIPTIQHFEGVCHIFVDASADLDKAVEVCATAKTSAPATCNAAECILVHESIAPAFVGRMVERYRRDAVEVRGDETVMRLAPPGAVKGATPGDWGKEFLDLVVAMRIVKGMNEAIEHIERFASNHTESILTRDEGNAAEFTRRVQSSVVLVNASTRFNDGFSLGLGAEIGISTTKLHAYGPMGLEELTTQRYIVEGDGHTR